LDDWVHSVLEHGGGGHKAARVTLAKKAAHQPLPMCGSQFVGQDFGHGMITTGSEQPFEFGDRTDHKGILLAHAVIKTSPREFLLNKFVEVCVEKGAECEPFVESDNEREDRTTIIVPMRISTTKRLGQRCVDL
jgi:hypothetical protein